MKKGRQESMLGKQQLCRERGVRGWVMGRVLEAWLGRNQPWTESWERVVMEIPLGWARLGFSWQEAGGWLWTLCYGPGKRASELPLPMQRRTQPLLVHGGMQTACPRRARVVGVNSVVCMH